MYFQEKKKIGKNRKKKKNGNIDEIFFPWIET